MPPIQLVKVVDVSSEDVNHKAENLLLCNFRRKWKSESTAKCISAVLQLEKPSNIVSIDVCNENSAFIEILVGNTSNPDEFKLLLENAALMSLEDAKLGENINLNKYFTKEAFEPGVRDQTWDLVKLICTQPFVDTQFGLSFLVLSD